MNPELVAIVITLVTLLGASTSAWPIHHRTARPSATDIERQNDEWHAGDLYDMDDEGVTAPVLVRETKPNYSPEARPQVAKAKGSEQFRKETFTAENLQNTLKYPPDWSVLKDAQSDRLIAVERTTEGEARSCTLSKLQPVKTDLMVAMTDSALKAYAKQIKEQLAADADIELLKVGQIEAVGHLWVWSEMSRRRPELSGVQPDAAAAFSARFDGMRIWQFTTSDSWQQLSVI